MTLLRTLRLICVAIGALFIAIVTVNIVKVSALRPPPSFDIEKLKPTGQTTLAVTGERSDGTGRDGTVTPTPAYVIPLGELEQMVKQCATGAPPVKRVFRLDTGACPYASVALEINAEEMVIYAQEAR
jgi:hypothetical protein